LKKATSPKKNNRITYISWS